MSQITDTDCSKSLHLLTTAQSYSSCKNATFVNYK